MQILFEYKSIDLRSETFILNMSKEIPIRIADQLTPKSIIYQRIFSSPFNNSHPFLASICVLIKTNKQTNKQIMHQFMKSKHSSLSEIAKISSKLSWFPRLGDETKTCFESEISKCSSSLPSFCFLFSLYLLFWNQIFICCSVMFSFLARFLLSPFPRYLLSSNTLCRARTCSCENEALTLLRGCLKSCCRQW